MVRHDYSSWSRDDLIKEITKLSKARTYGIVWEEKPEDVATLCQSKLPVLNEVRGKEIDGSDGATNFLIEGDNYHALSVLNYTHKGKVDVIYIDPPYNTGARDWKYNNDFVDINDSYRHSKWLSMMSKRLQLAKNLLRPDGVLICTIDDNEFARLGLLLEQVFAGFEVHCITIVHNPRGIQGKNFSYTHEYAYFVFRKGLTVIGPRKIKDDDIYWSNLRNWGGESLRTDARNCFYPIFVKGENIVGFGDVPPNEFHPKKQTEQKGDHYEVWPIDVSGIEHKWRYARQSVEEIQNLLRVRESRGRIEVEIGKPYGSVKTVWQDSRYDAGIYGTNLVHALVPKADFPFPKSVWNTYDCLAPIVSGRRDAVVLDYFAGSGTTAHALLIFNKEDGGKRRFILCTNNENGIAEDVCYPRISAVIKGHPNYPEITRVDASVKYFKTDFVDAEPTDRNKKKLVDRSTEMLCLREDCFEVIKIGAEYRVFGNGAGKFLGIVYSDAGIEPFKAEAKRLGRDISVYVFSLDSSAREEEFEDVLDLVNLKPIPEVILNVYRRIFR